MSRRWSRLSRRHGWIIAWHNMRFAKYRRMRVGHFELPVIPVVSEGISLGAPGDIADETGADRTDSSYIR